MADLCLEAWKSIPGLRVHVLFGENIEFQKKRREQAENMAKSSIYVCTDDDILPSKVDLGLINILFNQYQDYAILSAVPINCRIYPWNLGQLNNEVMEHVSVGGARFVRKGAMKEWPPYFGGGYDASHAEHLRNLGYKVGYSLKTECLHLGEGYSSVWPT